MLIPLENVAIFLVWKDSISYIEKRKGYNYHIEYYMKMAKKDPFIREVLNHYDLSQIRKNPSDVEKINKDLVRMGCCIFLNMAPQLMMPTNLFFGVYA